jgi:hypothetical protein
MRMVSFLASMNEMTNGWRSVVLTFHVPGSQKLVPVPYTPATTSSLMLEITPLSLMTPSRARSLTLAKFGSRMTRRFDSFLEQGHRPSNRKSASVCRLPPASSTLYVV